MKITGLIRQDSAVGFYRLVQPMRFLKRKGNDCRMTFFSGDNVYGENSHGHLVVNEQLLAKISKDADIIWSNFTANKDDMARMLDIRKWTGGKLIIDIDDNLYNASRDNPGELAKKYRKEIELSLKIADGLTVSVPNLKKLYEPMNKNIYIKPNGIDIKLYRRNLKPHKGIRIGWEGAYGHRADLELVYPAIKQLIKDYGITFVVFGTSPKHGLKEPDFPVEFHDWVGFSKYQKKLASLQLDIAVSPLIDSSYNRCKSNLRILDNSALHIPVVASPVENLKGLPCLYASNNWEWYNQLEKLILDRKERKKHGELQYDFIKENFSEDKLVKPLLKWFSTLERRTDLDPNFQRR